MFFLIWLGIIFVGGGSLWLTHTLIGPLFMGKFMEYAITWHEKNGFCSSEECQPEKLTHRSAYRENNLYTRVYGDGDERDKETRIQRCCVNFAKDSCKSWISSLWRQRNDMKALTLFSSIDSDRKELVALKKRDEKILEELRSSPSGNLDMESWQRIFDHENK